MREAGMSLPASQMRKTEARKGTGTLWPSQPVNTCGMIELDGPAVAKQVRHTPEKHRKEDTVYVSVCVCVWGGHPSLETKSQTGPQVPVTESPPPSPGSTPDIPPAHFFPSSLTSSHLHLTLERSHWLRASERRLASLLPLSGLD